MSYKILKYIFLPTLLGTASLMSSCTDDDLPLNDQDYSTADGEGDVMVVNLTLDNMGGVYSRAASESSLVEMENYVDIEKIRVLVFDSEDKFLFESKSRWVKQLDPATDHSVWSVSIPMYSAGNDRVYDWDWDAIRTKLTTEDFKIAILANRPDREWNMGIKYKEDNPSTPNVDESQVEIVKGGWFGSTGPHWTRKNSVVYKGDDADIKDVFDLHHCQYDPIYHGKNIVNTDFNAPNRHFYDFVTKDVEGNRDRPYMGATSSWVNWGNNDESGVEGIRNGNRDPHGWGFRKTRLPNKENPIPMYGIQKFAKVEGWKKGTTINLTRDTDKSISLLRSVVKLELLVPEGFAQDVVLFYSNIYARCEPTNVWTPTDELWRDEAGNHDNLCELDRLKAYGKITAFDNDHIFRASATYPQRLSWIYGSWMEKGWDFNGEVSVDNVVAEGERIAFPKLFNPCVQRNEVVYVEKAYTEGGYDYYVVYTGERNINDPSNLADIDNSGSGNPTAIYWSIVHNAVTTNGDATRYSKGDTYSLEITDYSNTDADRVFYATRVGQLTEGTTDGITTFKPRNSPRAHDTSYSNTSGSGQINGSWANGTGMGDYLVSVQGISTSNINGRKRNGNTVEPGFYDAKYYPLPLLRNHVYKITLNGSRTSASDGGFAIQSEILATEDIGFENR